MSLSLKFKCPSTSTGGQPLIQKQGHPNQVLSVETHPTCTPPASAHNHTPSQPCPQNSSSQAFCRVSPSTDDAGALSSLGSRWGLKAPLAGALCLLPAPSPPQAAPRVSTGLQPPMPSLWAGSGLRLSLLLLLAAHVWLRHWAINPQREQLQGLDPTDHRPPTIKQLQTPDTCSGRPPGEGASGFPFQVR